MKSGHIGRVIGIGGALLVLAGVVLYLSQVEDLVDVEMKPPEEALPAVAVLSVRPESHKIQIESYASIRPRWAIHIASEVSGRVREVSDAALVGGRVEQGTILARIEAQRFEAEVAAAHLAVRQAELAVWQAENAKLLAERQFKRDARKPPNDLALKIPQLEIARASLKEAKARLNVAERQLRDTVIVAPFSGFVTERSVSPGQTISAGEKLLRLVDDRVFELVVQVGSQDWQLLDHPLKGGVATILNEDGVSIGTASVREAAGFLDEKTRQHKIFLEIKAEENDQILAGDFVKVAITGKKVDDTLRLPEAARTQEGHVWFVDDQDRLERKMPRLLYRTDAHIIVKADESDRGRMLRVVTIPLASFLPGQKVQPVDGETR